MRLGQAIGVVALGLGGACASAVDTGQPEVCGPELLTWVRAPAGSFVMGSPTDERGRDGDEAQREVTLTRAYDIGAYEVTRAQFAACLGYDPSTSAGEAADLPVDSVSWHEAAGFAAALSEAAGLSPCHRCSGEGPERTCVLEPAWTTPYACPGYRLPTEAEWEHAARAGEAAAFHSGGNLLEGDHDRCDAELLLDDGSRLGDIAWFCGNGGGGAHPVGALASNAWGLHDVSGNVWEWVEDAYDPGDGSSPEDVTDPWVGEGEARVDRGGSWYDGVPALVRSAARGGSPPEGRSAGLGFRVARSVEP
jgi:sulfatase modifying factor 1